MSKKNKLPSHRNSPPEQPTAQQSVSLFRAESFSGPLPPPEMLQKYNEVSPGLADRIVSMAEKQSDHRRDLEKKVVYSNARRALVGQIMAFVIALAGIVAGVYLTMNDKSTEGMAAIFGPLIGLVGVFIYQKISQQKELAAKNRSIANRIR